MPPLNSATGLPPATPQPEHNNPMGITHGGDHVAALDAGIEGLRLLGIDAPSRL